MLWCDEEGANLASAMLQHFEGDAADNLPLLFGDPKAAAFYVFGVTRRPSANFSIACSLWPLDFLAR
tara:strand:+ start:776 stop:976 length:201 start_codon:yes stop_codon:yes gene_type:complete